MAQIYRPTTYFRCLACGVYVNVSYLKRSSLHAGRIIIKIILCIAAKLGIGQFRNHGIGVFAGNAHIRAETHQPPYILLWGI